MLYEMLLGGLTRLVTTFVRVFEAMFTPAGLVHNAFLVNINMQLH
jgi:hypothetical protein